jgi:hypothetical protein
MQKYKYLIWSLFLLLNAATYAQFKILLVKDEDLNFGNTDTVKTALLATGSTVDLFSAVDSNRAPSLTELKKYNLVVWYSASDGVGLHLWDIADGDTSALAKYISQGGMFWVAGLDFLYNKYGAPAVTFGANEFANKYLGIASYDVQSYGSDGGNGLPQAQPGSQCPYSNPAVLQWIYSTLWWADGCTPNSSAVASYVMGPNTYSLYGKACEIITEVNTAPVISTFFDPALIDTYANRVNYVKKVVAFFKAYLSVPVELSAFTASIINGAVRLNWTTATELNNKLFAVERSNDKTHFTQIGVVQGKGTSTTITQYSFTDKDAPAGVRYYRLKQIDFDGSFSYSQVVSSAVNARFSYSLNQNYPNPFNPSTEISYTLETASPVKLTVYNALGEEALCLVNGLQEAGSHAVSFNAKSLSSGLYFYTLKAGNFSASKKMILIK